MTVRKPYSKPTLRKLVTENPSVRAKVDELRAWMKPMSREEIVRTLRRADALGDCGPADIEEAADAMMRFLGTAPPPPPSPHVILQIDGVTVDPSVRPSRRSN